MNKEEYIKNWAEKLSLTVEEIESEFSKLLEDEQSIHPTLNDEQKNQRALQRLALTYKKQLRSPAVGFEGIIIGTSDCIDIIARQRREAIELYRVDPQTAIAEGITNEEGVPLDARKEWANGKQNQNYGKPLPDHNFMRNIFGIATKTKTKEAPRFFSININGDKATNEDIPLFKPVRFMAIDRTTPEQGDTMYQLNASTFTNFAVDNKLQLPSYRDLISKYYKITNLKEILAYHEINKDNFNRVVVVEGDVSSLNLEPTSAGSRVMVVEDSSTALEDLDAKGITCWVPKKINIDFAEGSRVLVVGKTSQGKKKDADGNYTEELGDVTINVYGCYAIPEYKIAQPEEINPITEENLDID